MLGISQTWAMPYKIPPWDRPADHGPRTERGNVAHADRSIRQQPTTQEHRRKVPDAMTLHIATIIASFVTEGEVGATSCDVKGSMHRLHVVEGGNGAKTSPTYGAGAA